MEFGQLLSFFQRKGTSEAAEGGSFHGGSADADQPRRGFEEEPAAIEAGEQEEDAIEEDEEAVPELEMELEQDLPEEEPEAEELDPTPPPRTRTATTRSSACRWPPATT